MDTPQNAASIWDRSPLNRLNPDHRQILVVVVLLAVLAVLGYAAYRYWGGIVPGDHEIFIASDGLPLMPLQTVNTKSGILEDVTVEGQGTAVLLDMANTAEAGFYLIADQGLSTSNLYKLDHANRGAGLSQITETASLKYDLSYDEQSGVAAFVSSSDGEDRVTVWSPLTNEEKDLGTGAHPVILPGGFYVVFEREGSLVSVHIGSGEVHELLSIAPGAPFAVDQTSLKLALYEPVSGNVQIFSVAGMTGASYESSVSASMVPTEIAFADGAVFLGRYADGLLTLSRGRNEITVPVSGSVKLFLSHDQKD